MDFGVVGLDHHHHHHHQGLGISSSSSSSNVMSSTSSPDPENKQRALYGSGNGDILKQERSAGSGLEEYWRSSKLARTSGNGGGADEDDFSSACKGMMFQPRSSSLLISNSGTDNGASTTTTTTTLSFLDGESYGSNQHNNHQMLSFSTSKSDAHNSATLPCFANAGYTGRNTAFSSGTSPMMMMRSGSGPSFTAAQWMELEHQALIYKYITANVPIPANLLLPIRRAFDSSPFPPTALFRSNPLHGVGAWGSFQLGFSNNADPEPGRCRRTDGKKWRCSRDAVADQKYCERHMNRGRHRSRKPVEGQAGANNNNNAAAAPNLAPLPGASAAATTGNAHQPARSFDINGASNRMFVKDGLNAANGSLSLLSSKDNSSLPFPRKQQVPYEMPPSARSSDFKGLVSSDQQQGSLHQFIDDWPNKTRPASPWPDRTQLSISIPTTETNLSLSREQSHDADSSGRQASWIPISWEASLGGPLGEVLHQGNGHSFATSDHCKSTSSTTTSSVLNLMPEGWDSSPPVGSSPTGVLQKAVFGSLSNSSAGSSPRAHLNPTEGIDLLGDNHRLA